MTRALIPLALLAGLGLAALPAAAQTAGRTAPDPQKGLGFAREVCAGCHAVEDGQTVSPLARALAFYAIADVPGMSQTALYALLSTPHKTMPNLILSADEIADVSAYILSLKRN